MKALGHTSVFASLLALCSRNLGFFAPQFVGLVPLVPLLLMKALLLLVRFHSLVLLQALKQVLELFLVEYLVPSVRLLRTLDSIVSLLPLVSWNLEPHLAIRLAELAPVESGQVL